MPVLCLQLILVPPSQKKKKKKISECKFKGCVSAYLRLLTAPANKWAWDRWLVLCSACFGAAFFSGSLRLSVDACFTKALWKHRVKVTKPQWSLWEGAKSGAEEEEKHEPFSSRAVHSTSYILSSLQGEPLHLSISVLQEVTQFWKAKKSAQAERDDTDIEPKRRPGDGQSSGDMKSGRDTETEDKSPERHKKTKHTRCKTKGARGQESADTKWAITVCEVQTSSPEFSLH